MKMLISKDFLTVRLVAQDKDESNLFCSMMLAGIGIDHYEVPDSDDEHDTEIVFKMGRPLGELGTGGGGREVDRFIVLSGSVKFIEEFQKQYVRISCEGDIPFTVAGNLKSWTNYNEVKPY
jgi:hypothetical protein